MQVKQFCMRYALIAPLVATLAAANAATYTSVFSQLYSRSSGAPQTITNSFERCGDAPCQIRVDNGAADGISRVSSASISLNGSPIIGPADFNQQVAQIVKPVTLGGQNVLAVTLASKPGSFLNVALECLASEVKLTASAPGVSLENETSLLSAITIVNPGIVDAQNVQVTEISLDDGTLTSPSLPSSLGTIPANGSTVLNANFSGGPFLPSQAYELAAEGTYKAGSYNYCFEVSEKLTIPSAAPGSAILGTLHIPASQTAGPYTSQPRPTPPLPPGVNPARWTVPIGPFVPGMVEPNGTAVQFAPGALTFNDAALEKAAAASSIVVFEANNPLGLTSGNANGQASTVAEPSGGVTGGGAVFVTANWTAAYSTDGVNFTQLDPTTIFPNDAVGFCCDQIVQYVPSIDRFIWLLQGNGYRLAMASPQQVINSNGTAWTYWNLTPDLFGQTSFDYPDLSVGSNSLYISWDGDGGGFQVARISLAGINAGGTITIGFTDPKKAPMAWGSHLMQDTGDEIFWAGHNNNSNMRIFSLKEDSDTYFWRDRNVSSWANNAPTSLTPDGKDWLAKNFNGPGGNSFPRNGIIGATRSGGRLWFAWTAGTNDSFKQAHVEMVRFDRNEDFTKKEQVQIWNDDYAFAYPALTTNACTGEVGLSFEYGGNSKYYQNHVVGFWGDYVAYVTTGSDVGTTRFGDYVTIRRAPATKANPGNLFAAFGYGLNKATPPSTGTVTDVRYVLFGRPASSCYSGPD